ncbi:MAG: hypothetical protein LBU14_04150, partial [Candidatus Peribacteria bacterium]|nr:hypothetical protein [Candidatus Peribacteria bacterium]
MGYSTSSFIIVSKATASISIIIINTSASRISIINYISTSTFVCVIVITNIFKASTTSLSFI